MRDARGRAGAGRCAAESGAFRGGRLRAGSASPGAASERGSGRRARRVKLHQLGPIGMRHYPSLPTTGFFILRWGALFMSQRTAVLCAAQYIDVYCTSPVGPPRRHWALGLVKCPESQDSVGGGSPPVIWTGVLLRGQPLVLPDRPRCLLLLPSFPLILSLTLWWPLVRVIRHRRVMQAHAPEDDRHTHLLHQLIAAFILGQVDGAEAGVRSREGLRALPRVLVQREEVLPTVEALELREAACWRLARSCIDSTHSIRCQSNQNASTTHSFQFERR